MKVVIGPYVDEGEREIDIVIHKYDTWNLESTLAKIIYPALVQFRQETNSAPSVDDEDVPENIRSTAAKTKENDWETDEFHFKRWDYVLDEMIWSFDMWIDGKWEEPYYDKNSEFYHEKQFLKERYDRIKNGFRLFGKYYTSLWS